VGVLRSVNRWVNSRPRGEKGSVHVKSSTTREVRCRTRIPLKKKEKQKWGGSQRGDSTITHRGTPELNSYRGKKRGCFFHRQEGLGIALNERRKDYDKGNPKKEPRGAEIKQKRDFKVGRTCLIFEVPNGSAPDFHSRISQRKGKIRSERRVGGGGDNENKETSEKIMNRSNPLYGTVTGPHPSLGHLGR